jgi:hypothetical protein
LACNPPPYRPSWWARLGCLLALFAGLEVAYLAYLRLYPYSRVEVRLGGIPAGTTFLCLVADRPGRPVPMHWWLTKLFPFTMHPDHSGKSTSIRYADDPARFRADVEWVRSARVGVLRRTKGRWFIAWFGPPKGEVRGRSFLFGGGAWEADLRDADEEGPVSEASLRALGMSYSLRDD